MAAIRLASVMLSPFSFIFHGFSGLKKSFHTQISLACIGKDTDDDLAIVRLLGDLQCSMGCGP